MADKLIDVLKEIGGLKPADCEVSQSIKEQLIHAYDSMPEVWKKLERAAYLLEQVIKRNGGVFCDDGIDSAGYRFGNYDDSWRVGELSEVARLISDAQCAIERKEVYRNG